MKKLVFLILVLFTNITISQENLNYDWGKPETYTPLKNEEQLGQIHIFDKTIRELVIEKNDNYEYSIIHTKTYINSDEAIERKNKIYIPFKSEGDEIVAQKVRVIKPDGKTIELNSSDIKETEDESTKVKYKYFAVRGLEKKCIVEQLVIGKFRPKLNGRNITLQDEYLNKNIDYELIYPKHLIYDIKSYNGLPNFILNDSLYKNKSSLKLHIDQIESLTDEKYSNSVKTAKRFTYKLAQNLYSGKLDLYNYKTYTDELLGFLSAKNESKDQNALLKFIKNIPQATDVQQKIRNIEGYVKKNIAYEENFSGEVNILTTLNNKFTSAYGLLKLYKSIFDIYKINCDLVVVSNRFESPIDPKFESYSNLDEFVLYFPESKGYLCPSEIGFRYPVIPYRWTNGYAIFTKYVDFEGTKTPDYEIKKIETPSTDFTHDEMDIVVDLTKNPSKPSVTSTISFNGYSAFSIQPFYDFIPQDKYGDFEKEIADNYCGQKENLKIETQNRGLENIGLKPFIFKVNYDADALVEKAGDKLLLKIGKVIGNQAELYQEGKRQMPIEIQYPHAYVRKIKVILPQGYTIKNLDKINSSYITNSNNDKEVCKFTTTHNLSTNELNIENIEYYKKVELPIEAYNDYVKVINAAADFNKLILILQKG